jgi:chemotaxis protein CheX
LDILECPDAQPVTPEVREELVEPFISAASMTLTELAQTELVVRSVYRTANPRTLGDISAVLGLGAGDGVLVLSLPAKTAAALAGRVLSDVTSTPEDDLVRDCMGELANVIAGQAKTLLAETPYQLLLATPSVLTGAGLEFGSRPGADGLVVVFGCEAGDFALQICLKR